MQGFLFGKLPAFGDFVARGLSPAMRSWWDDRCSAAVLTARGGFGDDFEQRDWATAPRRFLIAPVTHGDPWQAGCLVRSRDRTGRAFPFVLGLGSSARIDAADGLAIGERLAVWIDRAFAPRVDLDTLLAAAVEAARNATGARRSIAPICGEI